MTPETPTRPRLRPLDIQSAQHNGRRVLVLRDPLGVSDAAALVPQELAPLLGLCDGTREMDALRASLAVRYGLPLSAEALRGMVGSLDEALLLEGERFQAALAQATASFRDLPHRLPALAGLSYPGDPEELACLLQGLIDAVGEVDGAPEVRGLVTPHIDYPRGGEVYARVWKESAAAVRQAEVVVILGTDHHGGLGRITLTPQSYATPWGVLPTAADAVEAVARAVDVATSAGTAFAEELHHRGEHSIELAAVWLHHVRGGEPCEVLPVLCGSFAHYVAGQANPAEDPAIAAFVEATARVLDGRRALVVASADLAHVGPAFGGRALDLAARAFLRKADEEMMAHMVAGDAQSFFATLAAVGDRNNVCGLPPIYLAQRLLEALHGVRARGTTTSYDLAPADAAGTSVVSVCGMLWT